MIKQNSNGRIYFDNYKNKNIDIKRTKEQNTYTKINKMFNVIKYLRAHLYSRYGTCST